MAAAPGIYANDEWLHLICGFSSPWIRSASLRLLHPNTLLGLLRSQVGHTIMSHVESMALTNPCVDHIRALQAASEWLIGKAGGGAVTPAPRAEKRCRSAVDSSSSASAISERMASTSMVATTDSHAGNASTSIGEVRENVAEQSFHLAFASPPRKRQARRQLAGTISHPLTFTSPNYWEELDKFSFELSTQALAVGEDDGSLRVAVQSISSSESRSAHVNRNNCQPSH
ncbi:uncharacterized protein PHALS_00817 [Plasmopara halstedii]|uniref:Uncharacterized protein n=1 Tax=Plasmopara halstedii TaxID=4781 RepID=A0A0P1ATP9_PLAHL|nr:uncharacterized protein PHALS_00817 [Plasmopara halstedii]CEG44453.1 hypothetical protein PHALS_00817 [Plasmopara halstedii]|eukprot:XP_024580822.1 hypothetical protein PHALS_00817 [Plasmopara halstedii]